jgi:hypothetical protein
MKCPCGGNSIVLDGRVVNEGYWRKRRCVVCQAVSTTVEQVCETVNGHSRRQPVIKAPKAEPVLRLKKPRAAKPVTPTAPSGHATPRADATSARHRMEDARMLKELEIQ